MPCRKIDVMLYDRTTLRERPNQFIKYESKKLLGDDNIIFDMVFRSSDFLNFLGLKDPDIESYKLEDAIFQKL